MEVDYDSSNSIFLEYQTWSHAATYIYPTPQRRTTAQNWFRSNKYQNDLENSISNLLAPIE